MKSAVHDAQALHALFCDNRGETATQQTRGTAQRPGRTGLLDGLTRLHTKLLTVQRVADLPLSLQRALSSSADTLGDLARLHGLSTRALLIFKAHS